MDEARWLIRHFTVAGDTVYSVFDGTGTYTIAALLEGRSALSVDRDDRQQQHARARVSSLKDAEELRMRFWEKYKAYDEGPQRFQAEQLLKAAQAFGKKMGSPPEELVDKALRAAFISCRGVDDATAGDIDSQEKATLSQLVEWSYGDLRHWVRNNSYAPGVTPPTLSPDFFHRLVAVLRQKLLDETTIRFDDMVYDRSSLSLSTENRRWKKTIFDDLMRYCASSEEELLATELLGSAGAGTSSSA